MADKVLRYPNNIRDNGAYILLTRNKHNGIVTTEKLRKIDDQDGKYFNTTADSIIALPFPNNFTDSTGINYSSLQDFSTLGLDLESVKNKVKQIAIDKTGSQQAIQTYDFTKQARSVGFQQAVMFDSVNTKPWNLSWDLIPESLDEAQNIENIIKELTLASMPFTISNNSDGSSSGSSDYKFPDIIKMKMGGTTSGLIRFLPMVITGVDYTPTPQNYFQMYESGHFPHIQFSISLIEIVSRTRDIQNRLYNNTN